ncbi:hypothetical protein MKZ38_008300 [Zalerion maritima]|uniref:EKC/KEOPS complex subunit BUD32 n=1 Tax=Zalerion maritima TaxID=339359 RepID=A0AAD5RL23_9PEZI|nr:hypothetical protein MKZ38_008300 [Zalerion maritima]
MGSHYFYNCRPDQRFTLSRRTPMASEIMWHVEDWDQRRSLQVRSPKRKNPDKDKEEHLFLFEALAKVIDDLPVDALLAQFLDDGTLLSASSDITEDIAYVPFYPSRTDFPLDTPTVRRRDLIEVDRLGLMVDLTTYQPSPGKTKTVVFKYFIYEGNRATWWYEANCVMRIPKHDNIVSFDAVVLDMVDGDNKVVGFTTQYVPGGTLETNKDRVFKLKYLEQLTEVIDYLNLSLGIVHGDICPWNLLINPETDNIQIFDFNLAAKLGWEGDEANNWVFEHDKHCDDVKFVVFTLYEIITRELSFRREISPEELDASRVMRKRTWKKHPDVLLDKPVTKYRQVLAEWVGRRKTIDKEIDHFTKASEPLDLPPVPGFPAEDVAGRPLERAAQNRFELVNLGLDFLKWQRPPTRDLPLPKGRRLLATGEVVADDDGP